MLTGSFLLPFVQCKQYVYGFQRIGLWFFFCPRLEASYNPSYSQLFNSKLSVNVNKSTKRTYFPRIVEETSLLAQTVKNRLQYRRPGFNPWVGKIPWRRAWHPTPVFLPGESPWIEEPGRLQSMGSQSWTPLGLSTSIDNLTERFCGYHSRDLVTVRKLSFLA